MKDYSLNVGQSKDFILSYTIVDNIIIVKKSNNNVEALPYSIENEKSILEKMKRQVLNSKMFSKDIDRKFEIFGKLLMDEILLLVMFLVMKFSLGIALIPTIIGMISFPIVIGLTLYKFKKYYDLRNDIKKHLLFLRNQDCLNIIIRNNSKILSNLSDKLKGKILVCNKGLSFSFNTIDKIRYRELKQLYRKVEDVVDGKKCRVRRKHNREKRF